MLARRGKHQAGTMTSAERGTDTTCMFYMGSAVMFVPLLHMFKRLRCKFELSTRVSPGTVHCLHRKWVHQERLFVQWFRHFIQTTKPNKETKVLLLLDGHTAIQKYFQAVNLARGNGVILLSLQAHIKHRLRLLHVDYIVELYCINYTSYLT